MRTITGLIILGLLLGHGLGMFAVSVKLFVNRHLSRTFRYLSLLFATLALFLLLAMAASESLPKPRPFGYRMWMLAALIVLAIGAWPAIIHLLGLLDRKKNGK